MWQCSLGPPAIDETDAALFVAKVLRRCIYDAALDVELEDALPSICFQQIVHFSHSDPPAAVSAGSRGMMARLSVSVAEDFGGEVY